MNAEWWKGKSSRTGQEGIFPRSYVKVVEDKASTGNNYGNAPLEVSGMGNGESKVPGKVQEGMYPRATESPRSFLAKMTQAARNSARSLETPRSSVPELPSVVTSSTASSKLYDVSQALGFWFGVGCFALEIPLGRNTVCIFLSCFDSFTRYPSPLQSRSACLSLASSSATCGQWRYC